MRTEHTTHACALDARQATSVTVVNDGAVGERLPSLYTRLAQTLADADPRYAVVFLWAGPLPPGKHKYTHTHTHTHTPARPTTYHYHLPPPPPTARRLSAHPHETCSTIVLFLNPRHR